MAKTLEEAGKKLHVTEIQRHGEKITLPEEMPISEAIDVLQRRLEYEQQQAQFVETFEAFPFDGAHALWKVLSKKYGWASGLPTPGFFGDKPPQMIAIESGPNETVQVPWGRIQIPGMDGFLQLQYAIKSNRIVFQISVTTKRKHEQDVKALCLLVREYLKTNSIYKGKAIKIRFKDDDGDKDSLPEPRFLETLGLGLGDLVFSEAVEDSVTTNLFTPITRMEDCKAAGIPVKRGVLLAGRFGVGKTLAARIAARLAVENNITYVYVSRADEFAQAVEFAMQYQPAVVFCEDIDRVLAGQRSTSMDELLNIVDGIDSKTSEIMVVLTTNAVENINPAMLRPGRLDAVVNVTNPDAKAVIRLIKHYGKGFIDPATNLERVGEKLAGQIPAVIEEVVKRSKLAALKRAPKGTSAITVDDIALEESALTMKSQLELLSGKKEEKVHPAQPLLDDIKQSVEDIVFSKKFEHVIEKVVEKVTQ